MSSLEAIRRRRVAGAAVVDGLPLGAGRQLYLGQGPQGRCLISEGSLPEGAQAASSLDWSAGENGASAPIPGPLYPLGARIPDWAEHPGRLRTGKLLDPEGLAKALLQGASPELRLSWLVEFVAGLNPQAGLALDPAALGVCTAAPHLRVLDPQAPALSEPDQVAALANSVAVLLTSALPRGGRLPQGRLSPLLVDLLERAMDERPGVRPSLASFQGTLERALSEGDYAWRPRERPLISVLCVAGALLVLGGLSKVDSPPPARESAQAAFLAAVGEAEQNPAGSRLALERLAEGSPSLPEARRALALAELRRWRASASPNPASTRALVKVLQADGFGGRDDELAARLQLVCGVLCRWELAPRGDKDAKSLGDALLRDLTLRPSAADDLRSAARAALQAHPQGGELGKAPLSVAEIETLVSSGDTGGLLQRPDPAIRYASGPQPLALPLDQSWIADLLAGQQHALAGRQAEASRLLRRAYASFPCYATQVSFGLTLLRGPGGERSEGESLLRAPAQSEGGARLRLALAEGALSAGRLKTAIPELQAVVAQEGEAPLLLARAALLLRQAEILSAGRRVDDEPGLALEALQPLLSASAELEGDPHQGDLLLIAAAAQARLGRPQLGVAKVWEWIGARSLQAALDSLPALPLTLPSRDLSRVRGLLLDDLAARSAGGVQDTAGDAGALEAQLQRLGKAREGEAEVYALIQAALASLRYVKGESKLEAALEAIASGASARAPAQPLARIELEVRLRAAKGAPPPLALRHLTAAEPALVGAGFEGKELKVAQVRWRDQILEALRRFRAARAKVWATLTPEAPEASAQVQADLPLLRDSLKVLRKLPARQAPRLLAAQLQRTAALLCLARAGAEGRRDPASFAAALRHVGAGLELLKSLPPDPEVSEVRKGLHLVAGVAILGASPKATEAAKALYPQGQATPQAAARIHFCRAGGLLDPAMWREEIDAGFKPLGPTGRETSPLYWVARSFCEEAKAAPAPKQAQLKASAAQAYKDFQAALGAAKAPPPGAESWRQEAAWSARTDKP